LSWLRLKAGGLPAPELSLAIVSQEPLPTGSQTLSPAPVQVHL